jgi:LPXTG-site transpeptidase (sortase) family protein
MKKKKQGIIPQISQHPISFSASFAMVFALSIAFLAFVDALPEASATDTTPAPAATVAPAASVVATKSEAPVRVFSAAAGVDAKVSNPSSTAISVLDNALTTGAVRYPTSALLGDVGTVLLFGHSSHLPVVYNKAYQTFNDIEKLKEGDIVSVYSATAEYRYAVTSVVLADANEDVIELPQTGKHLILVTCDTFAAKSARYVVRADFVGTYALGN